MISSRSNTNKTKFIANKPTKGKNEPHTHTQSTKKGRKKAQREQRAGGTETKSASQEQS